MTDPTLTCPNCRTEIKLTESLAAPLIADARRRYETQLAQKEAEVAAREAAIRGQQEQLVWARQAIDAEVASRLDQERGKIAVAEALKAKRLVETDLEARAKEIADLNEVLRQRDTKLAEAQRAQADLVRKQRDLDDAKREIDLTIENRVQAELTVVRDKAKQETEAALSLRLKRKRRANCLDAATDRRPETEIRTRLTAAARRSTGARPGNFVAAEVCARPDRTGSKGRVRRRPRSTGGQPRRPGCRVHPVGGQTDQELERRLARQLREDQRAAKADVALIVSQALPKSVQTFDYIDGVWVADPKCAVAVAVALRESLLALSAARLAGEGQQAKMEMIYRYLTGPRFSHRIEAVVERFTEMQADLERERKAMTRLWAKREEQIRGIVESTAQLYGDLQGIGAEAFLEIDGLELPLLDGPTASEAAE
jgi:hypothetical protein